MALLPAVAPRMHKHKSKSFDWGFWFLWIMATAWGWVLGWILSGFFVAGIAMLATGLGIGALQWLVLKQWMGRAWRWIMATAVGWGVGWAISFVLIPAELGFVSGFLLGAATGIAQWMVLRTELHWAGWWIVVSALAWSLALGPLSREPVVGVTPGAMTGIALGLLLRYPTSKETLAGEEEL